MTHIEHTHRGTRYAFAITHYDRESDTLGIAYVCDAETGEDHTDMFFGDGWIYECEDALIDAYQNRDIDQLIEAAL